VVHGAWQLVRHVGLAVAIHAGAGAAGFRFRAHPMKEASEMSEAGSASWRGDLFRRVREKEIRRQIAYNRARKVGSQLLEHLLMRARIHALVPELLKSLLGAGISFWAIAALLSHFLHTKPLYTLASFGLVLSLQSTYYKYRLSVDPAFKIPKCHCAGARADSSEVVLRSKHSSIVRVPTSTLGAVLYAVLVLLVYARHTVAAALAASLAVCVSAYLIYVMVARIGALCANCMNIAALNVLILWQVCT
jgi:uncharacterized membrane protein